MVILQLKFNDTLIIIIILVHDNSSDKIDVYKINNFPIFPKNVMRMPDFEDRFFFPCLEVTLRSFVWKTFANRLKNP